MKGKQLVSEILLLLGILTAILFVIRLWPIVILAVVGILAAVIVLFCLAIKHRREKSLPKTSQTEEIEPVSVGNETENNLAQQISKLVQSEHQKAKWVWAQSDTQKRIAAAEDVFILLNGAGGYARAKVLFEDDVAVGLEYVSRVKQEDKSGQQKVFETEMPEEDYDSFAAEWLEAHIQDLNEQCNDTLGQGKGEMLLPAEMLPVKAAWVCICRELNQNGQFIAECVADGIKIKLA